MKKIHFQFVAVAVLALFLVKQTFALTIEEELLSDVNGEIMERRISHQLTPEEEILANEARAEIARVIENNLVKILAIIAAENEYPYLRQEEEEIDEIVTPNPNVLPQVAQILGAIFSGSLNITRIVDSTVGLVPNIVRTQLQGLVKLLTGENVNLSGSSSPSPPKEKPTTELDLIFEAEETTPVPAEAQSTESPVEVTTVSDLPTTTEKKGYRVRNKTRRVTTAPPPVASLVDDEVERIERDIRAAGRLLEPYEHRDPRIYAGMFTTLLQNVNMTEVAKAVPTIFKGATQAFVLLENLGVLDTLPGVDVLENLDLDLEE